ncbi:MAG: autotransporter-associated beta strand repeat-containing protein, partial [Verrucomicrobiae bacterium]|nr:autotransporter-associated beta strand repeat-containing protein [Verrucomicrobiae bacterium]
MRLRDRLPGAVASYCAVFLCVMSARAQVTNFTTNVWNLNNSGLWSVTNNWLPNSNFPNSYGAVVFVTNDNTFDQTIYLTENVTVGALLWGDLNRANFHGLRTTSSAPNSITFDTGDGSQALFVHGTGDRPNQDFGRFDDRTDVGIRVTDPEGLFIDNWQTFYFRGLDNGFSTDPARAFDGGGNNVTKGEDGYLVFNRVVTNIATWEQRDGFTEFFVEGTPARKPGISNLVLGVAPGTVDTGANPSGIQTNLNEGGAYDRVQYPYFSIVGAATTNGAGAAMTNDMHVTFNRGIFRSLARGVPNVSNTAVATLPVYTGTFTLNGGDTDSVFIIEHQNLSGNTGVIKQTIFSGPLTGSGGFTKIGTGEMTLMTNNDFAGQMSINRAFDNGRGRYGGVGLRENGTLSGVTSIQLNRDGGLYLDNSVVNLSNRVNDAAAITTRGRSYIEMLANGSAPSSERFGSVTTAQGSLAIEFDKADGSPQAQTLEIANLVRTPGSVIGFHASDVQQGVFASAAASNVVVRLLDGGLSLTQVGSGGGVGSSNRSVVVGVFGGDAVDNGSGDVNVQTPNRADEFMTVDGDRLRTLLPSERVSLGGRATNALTITQASAATDANVNIDFMSRQIELGRTALTNGSINFVDKRVVEDSRFNSIRLAIARGITANDNGRTLLISDGTVLSSESGMLLAGRDTGSASGDDTPNGSVYIHGGTIDLDGASNDREAILHNASGNSVLLQSAIDASQGLTKSGNDNFYLNGANNLGGTVNIAQGNLYVRNDRALRGANEVRVEGDGTLILAHGVAITNVNLRAGERPYGSPVLISESQHNVFGGDIMVENVDPQGTIQHDVRLRASANGQTASLTILGDIGLTELGASADVNLNDSVQVSFNESGGILNLKGTFGDRLVDGVALPVEIPAGIGQTRVEGGWISNRASTENRVLRFNIDGNGGVNSGDEMAVNVYNAWNSAGRIYAQQGTIRYVGEGDFWNSNALAVANFANGQSGFQLGGGGTDQGGSVTFLLTRDGQAFNAERWTVARDQNANNTITMGLEHFGPSNATVTIGNRFDDGGANSDDNRITIQGDDAARVREFRLFAHDGYDSATTNATEGRVNVIQSIRANNNFGMLTIVGNGRVVLQGIPTNASSIGNQYDESNDIRNFMLLGGELVLDRSTNGFWDGNLRRSDNWASTVTAGGDITMWGRNHSTSELLSSNLLVRAGDSRVTVVSGGGAAGTNTELFVATGGTGWSATTTRQRGGTIQFVEDSSAGGAASIRLGTTNAGNRVGSWATYGTNYGGGAFTWAATDAGSNVVAFDEANYQDNVGSGYGPTDHIQVNGDTSEFSDISAGSLRFTNAVALGLDGVSLDVVDGGILLTPEVAGGAASIENGSLTSSGSGELMVHNYAVPGGSFGIGASITGAVDVTFSGTGLTVLSTNNSYTGITRINGGTVQIDNANQLGSGATNLEMRGGTLFTTATTVLTNRTIFLGGDGGTFQVAAGTTNFIANVRTETNYFGQTRLNNGHGDLIKTGGGVLNLGTTVAATNNLIAGYNMYQGLTDVREGTLRVEANNNYALGSNKGFYDGTVVRGGATLTLASNNFQYAIQEWMIFEGGSTLRVEPTVAGYNSMSANGVMDFRGDTTVQILSGDFYFNSSGAGYIMGSGDIIKDGDATLDIDEYSPEYTGDLVIKDGTLRLHGYANNPLPNAGSIVIGLNDTTNRSTVAFKPWLDRNGYAGEWNIDQDITVQGYSLDTQLGSYDYNHNDVLNYNGDIDISNFGSNGWTASELRLWVEDRVEGRAPNGADESREELYINFNGDISGGDKRIRTVLQQNYYSSAGYVQSLERVPGAQLTNEMNMMVFFTMGGSNTGWTGSLEVGNRAGNSATTDGPDQDKQHFVRFGRNDGLATLAIGSSNSVVLRHDATLQAYGSQVTIGNLFSDGDSGGDGYFGERLVTNTFLENGGTLAGSFTIVQTSNRTFNGVIRDGTYFSPTTTNLASAALSIIKAGSGILTLDQSNHYSGLTLVQDGALRVNGSHIGGGLYGVLGGGTLGGTGLIQSAGVVVGDGGILAPGNSAGTLQIDSDLVFSNAAVLS